MKQMGNTVDSLQMFDANYKILIKSFEFDINDYYI
jgi:hypothetical protein